ncbi:MAG TPA: hypothetical protein PKC76_08415 [Saprospiraceae bacterium]|nr:hypothetical protein [Saprospiraceae bacterium]HMP24140.1 hypothetical protein [Saprospiraceae bacterium]
MNLRPKYNYTTSFNNAFQQLLLLWGMFQVLAFPSAIAQSTASCLPEIQISHITTNCLEKDLSKIEHPLVEAPCGALARLVYEDSWYELAQTGYFAFSRWEKKNGDGGVDVTGAPNCVLVEGANIAQVTVAPGRVAVFQIVVPAMGYATFDWKSIGGSNLLFSITVNAQSYIISQPGFYRSPLLRPGDVLALTMDNTATQHDARIELSDFDFLTNATAVIERRWTATDNQQHRSERTQFIAIEPLPLDNIIFPENMDLRPGESHTPNYTGYPAYDVDGNPMTMHDQHPLNAINCAFTVQWQDELEFDGRQYWLLRHWSVSDANQNVRRHTQVILPQDISGIPLQPGEILPLQQPSARAANGKFSAISNDSAYGLTTAAADIFDAIKGQSAASAAFLPPQDEVHCLFVHYNDNTAFLL